MVEKVLLTINTVCHMTPRQWKYRLYYMARNKLKKRKPKVKAVANSPFSLPIYYSANIDNNEAVKVAENICKNEIPAISGIVIRLNGDWNLKGEDYRLVCFKLNSFRWLLDLSDSYKVTGERKYIDKGFELIKEWHEKCGELISGDKWNAYVIAERITNWIGFTSEYGDVEKLKEIAGWIYPQAQELKDSLEYQLGANHLLSEAKAIVVAGVFLKEDEMYEFGKKVLIEEAKEQLYSDGGHYEQSISYHVEALQQYFEVYATMKIKGDADAERFVELMREPYIFLNGMIGVNGKIPLFNDAAYDYPFFDAADFLSTASYVFSPPPKGRIGNYSKRWSWLGKGVNAVDWGRKIKYDNTGFIHYQFNVDGKAYSFFMDCGNNGPDYNLGHTHADALSVLLYSEDKEILVDSGVFTYKPGAERNACRSTNAHNTVEVDGTNSVEIWSSFRVARRGYTKVIDCIWKEGLRIKASYDGYVRCLKSPVVHLREVTIKDGRIEIEDVLEGKGRHIAVSRFHISPYCLVIPLNSNSCLIDNIKFETKKEIRIVDCKVAGLFGIAEDAKCIEIEFSNSIKTVFSITKEKEVKW